MINIKRCFSSSRLMKALTGVSMREFQELLSSFAREIDQFDPLKERKRAKGGGKHHTLGCAEEKLFFILFYLKCYATFDVLGFFFDVDRSQPCRWVHQYLPVLEEVLGREVVLPVRKIKSIEEFICLFPDVKDVFIDGTERPIQRPKDPQEQRQNYSGKKKRHTKKNIIMTDKKKRILLLGDTHEGKKHDKKACDQEEIVDPIPPDDVTAWLDSGFQGIGKDHPGVKIKIPKKKPKGGELSEEEKENNREISKVRIIVENTLAGVKRYRIVHDIFRNKRKGMDDQVMLVACGLWNYHLKMAE